MKYKWTELQAAIAHQSVLPDTPENQRIARRAVFRVIGFVFALILLSWTPYLITKFF